VLVIGYDVQPDDVVEPVALINAVEENGADPDGEAWLAWRRTHEDAGMGCARPLLSPASRGMYPLITACCDQPFVTR